MPKRYPYSIRFTDYFHPLNRKHPSNWQPTRMAKRYPCSIKFTDCFRPPNCQYPSIGSRRESPKGAMILKISPSPSKQQPSKTIKTRHSFQIFHHIPSSSSQRNEAKRASYLKYFQSFLQHPSLIQRNSERIAQPQKHTVYKLFTTSAPTISAVSQND